MRCLKLCSHGDEYETVFVWAGGVGGCGTVVVLLGGEQDVKKVGISY